MLHVTVPENHNDTQITLWSDCLSLGNQTTWLGLEKTSWIILKYCDNGTIK